LLGVKGEIYRMAQLDTFATGQEGLVRSGKFCGGVISDLMRRLPYYKDDFKTGLHPKVLGSTLFLFFACLANAIAFGALTGAMTGNEIGTIEMIVATAIGGTVFALFSGQPLTLLGGTGPIVIFTALLYQACQMLQIPFLATYAWVGIWSGFFMIILAVTDASALMRFFTRFIDEIFAGLIAVIFIVEAGKEIISVFTEKSVSHESALLSLVLALGTYFIARTLKNFSRTPYLRSKLREFVSDFGPAIAIATMTAFAIFLSDVDLKHPAVPLELSTTSGRAWLVDIFNVPTWVCFAAAFPALLATILLFLDQNITTRLVNNPAHRLSKGPGYHLDLLIVGVLILLFSFFALPWIVAATVHSLNHVKSLATMKVSDENGAPKEEIDSVRETRVSALSIHILIGFSIFFLPTIHMIPMSVLFGLFLFMGFASLSGNEFFERLRLWITDPSLYPKTHFLRTVPHHIIHRFTAVQLLCLIALWLLKTSKVGILFPLLIAALVPIRLLLERFFSAEHLAVLDAEEKAESEDMLD